MRAIDVAIWRGGRCLFEGLQLTLGRGQLALLVGANGAGKTTLLRVLAGLSEPTSGRVTLDDIPVSSLPAEKRGAIAYRGHLDGLKRDLTVSENLRFNAEIWGRSVDTGVLGELKLDHVANTRARHLSAGQRRRAALASLRTAGASLWILDEPTANLDREGRSTVVKWTNAHLDSGGSAVIATHQPDEFARRGALVVEL